MKASKKTNTFSMCAAVKRDGYNLPSHDALTQILPNYRHPVKGAKTKPHHAARQEQERAAEKQLSNKPIINHTHQIRPLHKQPPLHGFEDELQLAQITEPQTKEVERYHSALSMMAEDIIALRTQVVTLEAEKSRLSLHQDLGRHLLDNTDIDIMTKAELADCIASLKFKLSGEASEAASQRNTIQQLQNELIKKNDIEKELLRLQRVVQQQAVDQKHHQSCLARMATLEATVKRQEKIIEKMEKPLDSKFSVRNEQSGDKGLVEEKQKESRRQSQSWQRKSLVSDKRVTGFASSLVVSLCNSQHRLKTHCHSERVY